PAGRPETRTSAARRTSSPSDEHHLDGSIITWVPRAAGASPCPSCRRRVRRRARAALTPTLPRRRSSAAAAAAARRRAPARGAPPAPATCCPPGRRCSWLL
ncbi:hypothetical protein BS78_04G045200, partial [Paspalum vaginatum]